MDRLGQLRGEQQPGPDSSGASSIGDPFVTADSSKYFSLSEGDTSVESPATTKSTDLISGLSPISKNNDLSGYKIGEQIEAANILSGGVDIFDDDNSNDDGLVIDDNPMERNDEKSASQDAEECKHRGSESTGEETLMPSETTVQIKEAEIQNTEITLNIDGKNVNAIDIGNDLYLYRLEEEGEQQGDLAAVQIVNSNQEQPTFKFLKVRCNDEGNLEVYEEIVKEIAEEEFERRKLPAKDVKKDVNIKGDKSLIKDSKAEKKLDTTKPLKFGSEARKSPIGITFHSTPIKEGVPLTKTMVDLHLQTSLHSDITKKTIEVNTDGCKSKPTEVPKNDTSANNQILPLKKEPTMEAEKQTDIDNVKIQSSEIPQDSVTNEKDIATKIHIDQLTTKSSETIPQKADTHKGTNRTFDNCKIKSPDTKVKNTQELPSVSKATDSLMDSIIDKERAVKDTTSYLIDDKNLTKKNMNETKVPTIIEKELSCDKTISTDQVDEKATDSKSVVKDLAIKDNKIDDLKDVDDNIGKNDNKVTETLPKEMITKSLNEFCLHNSDTMSHNPESESKTVEMVRPDKIEMAQEAKVSAIILDSDKKQLLSNEAAANDNKISGVKEETASSGTEQKNPQENKLPKELHTSNSKLGNEIKPKSLNNNNNAVPFGQWTEANKQEYLNKIKDYKTSTSNNSSNQIKQTNDLNRRDFHIKIDGKFAGLSKNETTNINKTPTKAKPSVSKPEKAEPARKHESNDRSDIVNFKDLIDKEVERMLMDKPTTASERQEKETSLKQENVKEKSTSNTLSDIELKMNELHGTPFVERPPHKLPSRFHEDRKKYDKVMTASKVLKPTNPKPSSKIPNLLPLSSTAAIQHKDKDDLISDEDILDYPPVTGDSDPAPIITEKDFDKFARRNSVTYERQVTVKFDAKKKPSIVQTAVEKTNLNNPIIAKSYKQQYFGKPSVAIKPTANKEPENKGYSSNIKLAYHSALTAKRQRDSPITVIEDKPVKVVYMENSNEFGPYTLNVQGQELTSKSDPKPTSDIEMLSSCDSLDDVIAEPKKHLRKQDLTLVDAPDVELIEPTDLGLTPKRKRKTVDLNDHQSKRSPKNDLPRKSYLLSRKVEDLPTYNTAKSSLNTIDSLVMAAELLEKQPDVAKAIVETNTNRSQDTPVKRGRGRPRKYPLPDEDPNKTTLNNTISPKNKAERERSITSISDLSETLDSSDDEEHQENWTMGKINENIVCPICSKLFRSENVVFKHVKHCTGPSPNRSESSRTRSRGPGADKSDSSAEDDSEPAAKEDDDASLQSIKDMLDKKQASVKNTEPKQMKTKIPTSSQSSHNSNNVCQTCGKAFRQLSYLVNHRLIHTKEAPKETTKDTKNVLSCKICNKEFRKLHHLAQHRITHRNQRNVSECNAKSSADPAKNSTDTLEATAKKSTDTAKSSVDKAKSSIETAKSSLDTAKSSVDKAKSSIDTAKSSVDKAKSSIDTAKSSVYKAKSSMDTAKSSVDKAKSSVDTVKSSVDTAKSSVDTAKTSASTTKSSADTTKASTTKAAVVGVGGRTSKSSTEEHDKSIVIRCEQCQKTFRKLHHLAEHRETHSGISKTKAANTSIDVEKASSPPPPTCNICNKSFRKLHHLSEHKDNKCEGKKGTFAAKQLIHECPLCYMVFPNEHSLEKHTISCRRKKRQSALKQAKEINVGLATADQTVVPTVADNTAKTVKVVTNPADEKLQQKEPPDSKVTIEEHKVPEPSTSNPQTRTSKRHLDDAEPHSPTKVKKLDEVKDKAPTVKDETKPTPVKKPAKKVEEVKPAAKPETKDSVVKSEVKEEHNRQDVDTKKEVEDSKSKKAETSVIELSDDDEDDVRYMFNPDFREKEFHKVKSQKRNSLTLDRTAGKSSTKRRISLQHTSRPSRTPSTSVPDNQSAKLPKTVPSDDDIKYSFPKTKRKDDKPKGAAADTSKVTQSTLPGRRKSQPKVVKKTLPKKEPVPAHRCDCGQLFGSGALLARHATLVHTPPRRTIQRTLPHSPTTVTTQTNTKTLKPRRTLTRK